MAQTKVSDYFQSKKGACNPSKKRKLDSEAASVQSLSFDSPTIPVVKRVTSERKCKTKSQLTSKRSKAASKSLKISKIASVVAESVPAPVLHEVSASKDDHNGSPVNTPIKSTCKRPRETKEKDMLQDVILTPDKGYNFTEMSGRGSVARKRLILEPKPSSTGVPETDKSSKEKVMQV